MAEPRVEGIRRVGKEERERHEARMERRKVRIGRSDEKRRWRPHRKLLFHVNDSMKSQPVEVDHLRDESVRLRNDGTRNGIREKRKINASAGKIL